MSVKEDQLPDGMLACARSMYEAFLRNMGQRRLASGETQFRDIAWDQLSQDVRDDWCAATVAAFQHVARGVVGSKSHRDSFAAGVVEDIYTQRINQHRVETAKAIGPQPLAFECRRCHKRQVNTLAHHVPGGEFRQIINATQLTICPECKALEADKEAPWE